MSAPDSFATRRAGWMAVLVIAATGSSLAFACATPFAALATLAALHMRRRYAFIVTGLTWVTNQAVGYGVLHYPDSWDSFTWGIAIGAGAVMATALAAAISSVLRPSGWVITTLGSFAAAFGGYEITLYAATALLPSDASAFSLAVVLYLLKVNVVAFAGLLILQYAAWWTGLVPRQPSRRMAPTAA